MDRAGRRLPLPARHGARRHLSIALVVQRLVPLVASITNPAYTPLFSMAAGVVTDIGGVLSHGSIVAREYGIPAVLGTGSATKRIRTGDLVTVDGDRGAVLLPGASPAGGDSAGGRRPWLVLGAGVVGVTPVAGVVAAQRARSKRCQNSLR